MNRNSLASRCLSGVLFLLTCFVTFPAQADSGTETSIYAFQGEISGPDGSTPDSGLILASDGNFYGTTVYGGSGNGTVFKLTPTGVETVLFAFDGTHGAMPSDLIQGSDGNLYGTTYWGGPHNGYGVVYKISTAGALSVLYNFTNDGSAGVNPISGLVEGADGNFYGTTSGDGHGFVGGTIFKITPSGKLTLLHSFSGNDGSSPRGKLILARNGNFYGTASQGGAGGYGTIFQMRPSGVFKVLYSFSGNPDGAAPNGPLFEGSDGSFYGVTEGGGIGNGTVFRIIPSGQETILHSFAGPPDDGALETCGFCWSSSSGLVEGSDGNFYGLTQQGGSYTQQNCSSGCGTLFMITPDGNETILHSFTGPWNTPADGWAPSGSLLQTSSGVFWGVTENGITGGGNVFKYVAPTSVKFLAKPAVITLGQSTTLGWLSIGASSCTASGNWTGAEPTSGRATVTPSAGGTAIYTLTCTGPGGTGSASATLRVR